MIFDRAGCGIDDVEFFVGWTPLSALRKTPRPRNRYIPRNPKPETRNPSEAPAFVLTEIEI